MLVQRNISFDTRTARSAAPSPKRSRFHSSTLGRRRCQLLSIAEAIDASSPAEELGIAMFSALAELKVVPNREWTEIAKPFGIRPGRTEHEGVFRR